ncbi:hypothetical protein, partial [Serratia marcescens]
MVFRWTRGWVKRQIRAVFAFFALLAGWLVGGPATAATAVRSVAVVDGRIDIRFDGPVPDATGLILKSTRQIAVD